MSNVHDYRDMVWSQAQVENRRNFSMAVKWAKSVMTDERIYLYYKKKAKGAQTPYNVAIGDYMKQLKLKVDLGSYRAGEGGTVTFRMKHFFGESSVSISLLGPGSQEIENGPARNTDHGYGWCYTIKGSDSRMTPGSVKVTLFRGPVSFTRTFALSQEFQ